MIEKMQNVNIPWKDNTIMVKKLEFNSGEFFIGKFIHTNGYISWSMHESKTGELITITGMVAYVKENDNHTNDKRALDIIISRIEKMSHMEFASLL